MFLDFCSFIWLLIFCLQFWERVPSRNRSLRLGIIHVEKKITFQGFQAPQSCNKSGVQVGHTTRNNQGHKLYNTAFYVPCLWDLNGVKAKQVFFTSGTRQWSRSKTYEWISPVATKISMKLYYRGFYILNCRSLNCY